MKPIPKHLPVHLWPDADRQAFARAYEKADIFDETAGSAVHLSESTKTFIEMVYRRWLGFVATHHPNDLDIEPDKRLTRERIAQFVADLEPTYRSTSILATIERLHHAARLIGPDGDWAWLKAIVQGLSARAEPLDRFDRLVPPWQTFDLGIELMDSASTFTRTDHRARELRYRDGLIIALLSLWPIRRRSLAALTVDRHVITDCDGFTLLVYREDTKSKREESFRVPDQLAGYLQHYLDDIRPKLLRQAHHSALWVSYRGGPLADGQIYEMVRRHTKDRFGKDMCLHDFRRAAATFLAIEAPEMIGLVPGVLHHTSPDVSDRHYNLARSTEASRRHGSTIAHLRKQLPRGATK
jgi:integrase/recombinase XerD